MSCDEKCIHRIREQDPPTIIIIVIIGIHSRLPEVELRVSIVHVIWTDVTAIDLSESTIQNQWVHYHQMKQGIVKEKQQSTCHIHF